MKAQRQPQQWALFFVLSAALTACTTNPTNDALVEAREAVQQAEQSQAVVEHAPRQLQEAQKNLGLAQRGWEEYGNDRQQEVDHLAYLAEHQALTALEQAAAAETRQKIANMDARRKEVLLQARNRELEVRDRELQERDQELAQLREETQTRQREAEELRNRVESLKAEATDRGLVLTLDEILFDLNEAQLKPGGVNAISRLAQFLQENPQRQILIEGHTDALGDEGYNMELSRERAQAVQRQLAQFGIPRERIDVKGYGEQFPVANNNSEAGRQQNRRVEIVIADQGETPESRPTAGSSSR